MKRFIILMVSMIASQQMWSAVGDKFESNKICYEIKQEVSGNTPGEVKVVSKYYTSKQDIAIPESVTYNNNTYFVTEIGDNAFSGLSARQIYSVTIAQGVKKIGNKAFSGCYRLSTITIPSGLSSLGDYAFDGCRGLQNVSLEGINISLGEGTFRGCISLTSFEFEKVGSKIGPNCFYDCSSLSTITIPSWINSIGDAAFAYCTSLRTVSFEGSNISLGRSTFSNCSSLTSFEFEKVGSRIGAYCFVGCSSLTVIVLPQATETIENDAFKDCTSLSSLTFMAPMVTIGENAFKNCSKLNTVNVSMESPKGLSNVNSFEGIDSNAILYVPIGLKSVYESNELWNNAFSKIFTSTAEVGQRFEADIKIGDNVERMQFTVVNSEKGSVIVSALKGGYISDREKSLILSLPSFVSVDECEFDIIGIGESVFEGTELSEIHLPSSISEIHDYAFRGCSKLASLELPKSISVIGKAFVDCALLKNIHVSWRDPSKIDINDECFNGIADETILFIPDGKKKLYSAHPVFGRFTQIVENSPISISDITSLSGSKTNVLVCLNCPEEILGVQFKLTLPEGCTIEENDGNIYASTTDRTSGMSVMGRKDPDSENSYLFVLLSFEGRAISGNEGAILDIPLTLDSNMDLGTYGITIEDVHLATASLKTEHPSESTSELTIKNYTLGDVNSDGKISIFDAVQVVNYILGSNPSGFVEAAADMDGNERITIFDAVSIVNVILSQGN